MMNSIRLKNRLSVALGLAFLLQAITSLISGAVFFDPLVVASDIAATMRSLAANPAMVHGNIMGDVITSIGIIFLAAVLYKVVKQRGKMMASFAFALYLFEATLLTLSKCITFVLLRVSEHYLSSGDAGLEFWGRILLEFRSFTYQVHMIPFGIGAIIFYYLLFKSKVLPNWLPLWGLLSVPIILVGVILLMYGVQVPFVLLVPYVPFEFFTGIFILIRGLKQPALVGALK